MSFTNQSLDTILIQCNDALKTQYINKYIGQDDNDNNTYTQIFQQANKFLHELQIHPIIWDVGNRILSTPQLPQQYYFFASNALLGRMQTKFSDLDSKELRFSFRDTLFHHIDNFLQYYIQDNHQVEEKYIRQVQNCLSMCISALICQMTSIGDWDTALIDICKKYSRKELSKFLFDILTEIPSLLYSPRMHLVNPSINGKDLLNTNDIPSNNSDNNKQYNSIEIIEGKFRKYNIFLLDMFLQYYNAIHENMELLQSLYKCIGSWCESNVFTFEIFQQHEQFEKIFEKGSNPKFIEYICIIIRGLLKDIHLTHSYDIDTTNQVQVNNEQNLRMNVAKIVSKILYLLIPHYNNFITLQEYDVCKQLTYTIIDIAMICIPSFLDTPDTRIITIQININDKRNIQIYEQWSHLVYTIIKFLRPRTNDGKDIFVRDWPCDFNVRELGSICYRFYIDLTKELHQLLREIYRNRLQYVDTAVTSSTSTTTSSSSVNTTDSSDSTTTAISANKNTNYYTIDTLDAYIKTLEQQKFFILSMMPEQLESIVILTQLPEKGLLNKEQYINDCDEQRNYRYYSGDTLYEIGTLSRQHLFIQQYQGFIYEYTNFIQKYNESNNNTNDTIIDLKEDWSKLESILFLFRCINRLYEEVKIEYMYIYQELPSIYPPEYIQKQQNGEQQKKTNINILDEYNYITSIVVYILEVLLSQPLQKYINGDQLVYTIYQIYGKYSKIDVQFITIFERIFQNIQQGMLDIRYEDVCSSSFRKICFQSTKQLCNKIYLDKIFEIYLQTNKFSIISQNEIVEGITVQILEQNQEDFEKYFTLLLNPIYRTLEDFSNNNDTNDKLHESEKILSSALQKQSSIIEVIEIGSEYIYKIITNIMTSQTSRQEKLAIQYNTRTIIIEDICKVWRVLLLTLKNYIPNTMIEHQYKLITNLYIHNKQSGYIYVANYVLRAYPQPDNIENNLLNYKSIYQLNNNELEKIENDECYIQWDILQDIKQQFNSSILIKSLLDYFIPLCIPLLKDINELNKYPDIVEDFIMLCAEAVHQWPIVFLRYKPNLEIIINIIATITPKIIHREIFQSCITFLQQIYTSQIYNTKIDQSSNILLYRYIYLKRILNDITEPLFIQQILSFTSERNSRDSAVVYRLLPQMLQVYDINNNVLINNIHNQNYCLNDRRPARQFLYNLLCNTTNTVFQNIPDDTRDNFILSILLSKTSYTDIYKFVIAMKGEENVFGTSESDRCE